MDISSEMSNREAIVMASRNINKLKEQNMTQLRKIKELEDEIVNMELEIRILKTKESLSNEKCKCEVLKNVGKMVEHDKSEEFIRFCSGTY